MRHMVGSQYLYDAFGPVGENFKSVYLPFSENGVIQKAYYFNPDHTIDGKKAVIRAIEIVDSVTNSNFGTSPDVKDTPAASILASGYLVISNAKREKVAEIPLYSLIKRLNSGKLYFTNFRDHVWQDCHVEFTDISSITSAVGLWFVVYYDVKNQSGYEN